MYRSSCSSHPEQKIHNIFIISLSAGGKIEKNVMGGACGAYGAGERGVQGSDGET